MEGQSVETMDSVTQVEFTNISLDPEKPSKKKKVPKRILHFSDGTLEEFSSSEDEGEATDSTPPVNPKSLAWFPWMWYYFVMTASGTFSVADKCGEKLAWFFGITSPKYQAAIDEYYRLKEEEEKEKAEEDLHSMKISSEIKEIVTSDIKITSKQPVDEPLEKY